MTPPTPTEPGAVTWLDEALRLILAPNPSPMTFNGTNTYIVGRGAVAVIDPGPDNPAHIEAILAALGPGEAISHILVTHSHLDHSPLAGPLSRATGAPVLAYGPSSAGRSAQMEKLGGDGALLGGEGVDTCFAPDIELADGAIVEGSNWRIEALWTPGHFGNHMCFSWQDRLFSGDLVMGWASSLVSPPDGELSAFLSSCQRLRARSDRIFYPGHGDPVKTPAQRLDWLIAHRARRTQEILATLEQAPGSAAELAARIYTEVDPALLGAAARNVLAHLIDLANKNIVSPEGTLSADSKFSLRR